MTNEEIVQELEKVLLYRLTYAGIDVVPATQIENLINRLKTKGSE